MAVLSRCSLTTKRLKLESIQIYREIETMRNLIICCLSVVVISACSTTSPVTPLSSDIDNLELFLSRSSMTKVEFETYKLENDSLYVECGPIVGGRFKATEQNLILVDSSAVEQVFSSAEQAIALYSSRDWNLDEAGKSNTFFDPGQFYLKATLEDGTRVNLETSLDTVSEPKSKLTRKLKELSIKVRAASKTTPCSNRSFYGIPVKESNLQPTRLSFRQ